MKKRIDIGSWNRREHYEHFRAFDDPYFGITTNVDVTNLYEKHKEDGDSLFILYFYHIMLAVNQVENFRYRIEDDVLVCYDVINASSTVGRYDGTFAFAAFDFSIDFNIFKKKCEEIIKSIQSGDGLMKNDKTSSINIIHYSPVPWIQFTEMKHPLLLAKDNSIPLISSGKIFKEGDKMLMPISISVNHALMDGYHVAQFLDIFNSNVSSIIVSK